MILHLKQNLIPDVSQALAELSHHRLRSALTLLGMVFGVGAVIAMIAVSEGGRQEALQMIEGMGVSNIIVESHEPEGESLKDIRKHSAGLSVMDAQAISETLPFITRWGGVRHIQTWDLFSHEGESRAQVWAVSPDYLTLSKLKADSGRLLNEADDFHRATVAVLGGSAAYELFPNGEAVGKLIKINHLWVEVVGVLRDLKLPNGEIQGRQVGGEGNRVYLPLQTGLKRLRDFPMQAKLSQLKLEVDTDLEPAAAATAIQHLLARRHNGQDDTRMVIPARLLAQQQQTQRIFTIVMSAVAGISLLVGGIGIMNIMLASVMERRSEIGLLRAIGAQQTDIVRQFLVETTVIALLGAVTGIALGVAIAYLIAGFAGWAVAWSIPGITLAVVVCTGIAVGFGVYPALSAAKLDPVAALQSD
ncbi:MAG: ABC transporter permease [OM182 bacterium MED-G24]|uniref:ABC transporter permease n=1 Tax=OM182 bacterium MED-G24 TaxID=1986255 RepID=A0A2A5WWN8_9GAMM|nr:MAG: ABC transporter permease [OM182 bacterium MED-G24]